MPIFTKLAGIPCPKCGCADLRTTHTRKSTRTIRRRRECKHCLHAFWTIETLIRDAKKP